jgi:hypothetical protein
MVVPLHAPSIQIFWWPSSSGLPRLPLRGLGLIVEHQQGGSRVGLTIETVSRVLTRLKGRGILSIKKLEEVGVSDVCRLCRLSGTHLTNGRWCSSRADTRLRDPST